MIKNIFYKVITFFSFSKKCNCAKWVDVNDRLWVDVDAGNRILLRYLKRGDGTIIYDGFTVRERPDVRKQFMVALNRYDNENYVLTHWLAFHNL